MPPAGAPGLSDSVYQRDRHEAIAVDGVQLEAGGKSGAARPEAARRSASGSGENAPSSRSDDGEAL